MATDLWICAAWCNSQSRRIFLHVFGHFWRNVPIGLKFPEKLPDCPLKVFFRSGGSTSSFPLPLGFSLSLKLSATGCFQGFFNLSIYWRRFLSLPQDINRSEVEKDLATSGSFQFGVVRLIQKVGFEKLTKTQIQLFGMEISVRVCFPGNFWCFLMVWSILTWQWRF